MAKFEYGCDPIIIEGNIALGLRKLLENDSFRSFFSVMVGGIQRMFGTHMYHEEMQVKFEYGCFLSRSRIFRLYGDVTIAGEELQNLGLCSALRAFEISKVI